MSDQPMVKNRKTYLTMSAQTSRCHRLFVIWIGENAYCPGCNRRLRKGGWPLDRGARAMSGRCEARRLEWLTQGPGMRGAGMGHGFYRVYCEKPKGHRSDHDNGYETWRRKSPESASPKPTEERG